MMKATLSTHTLMFFLLNIAAFAFVPMKQASPRRFAPLEQVSDKRLTQQSATFLDEVGQKNKEDRVGVKVALDSSLNPVEAWCVTHMDVWYKQSLSVRCPFMRRRMADLLDAVDMIMRFLVIRHKSLDLIGPPPGCRSSRMSKLKTLDLSLEDIRETIRQDWREDTNKGYYITGRLNTTIYRDDCLFDGPDPDMPVRGLQKYLNAASNLFDHAASTAELLSLDVVGTSTIVAKWKLQGVLHLPWHPKLPIWTGSTTYHVGDDGLISRHEESWDISVLQAFAKTLWPEAANFIWDNSVQRK